MRYIFSSTFVLAYMETPFIHGIRMYQIVFVLDSILCVCTDKSWFHNCWNTFNPYLSCDCDWHPINIQFLGFLIVMCGNPEYRMPSMYMSPSISTSLNMNGIAHVAVSISTSTICGWCAESNTCVTQERLLPTRMCIRFPLIFCKCPSIVTPSGRRVLMMVRKDWFIYLRSHGHTMAPPIALCINLHAWAIWGFLNFEKDLFEVVMHSKDCCHKSTKRKAVDRLEITQHSSFKKVLQSTHTMDSAHSVPFNAECFNHICVPSQHKKMGTLYTCV